MTISKSIVFIPVYDTWNINKIKIKNKTVWPHAMRILYLHNRFPDWIIAFLNCCHCPVSVPLCLQFGISRMQTIWSPICCSQIYNDDLRRKECQIGYLKTFRTKIDPSLYQLTPNLAPKLKKNQSYTSTRLWVFATCYSVTFAFFVFSVLWKNSVHTSQRTQNTPIQRHNVTCQTIRILKLYHVHHKPKFLKETLKPTRLSPTFVTTQHF